MSSKLKIRDDYHILNFHGQDVALMLGEIRKFDSRRVADKMGILSEEKFKQAWRATLKLTQLRVMVTRRGAVSPYSICERIIGQGQFKHKCARRGRCVYYA